MPQPHSSSIMCELEWINIASKSLAYCAQLLQQIKQLKEKFEKLQEEAARLKVLVKKQEQLVQDLTERHGGYDTVHYLTRSILSSPTDSRKFYSKWTLRYYKDTKSLCMKLLYRASAITILLLTL